MNEPSKHQEPPNGGSDQRLVRQFVVQERHRTEPSAPDWFDDPDQPPHTEATPEAAMGWLVRDTREAQGHARTFEHRLIERTERVYHTEADCDRVCLPNSSIERTKGSDNTP